MGNDNKTNIDMYVTDSGQSNFTTGGISGTARRKSAKNDFVSGFFAALPYDKTLFNGTLQNTCYWDINH